MQSCQLFIIWLRTNGVNTKGAAAKIINFGRFGKKVHMAHQLGSFLIWLVSNWASTLNAFLPNDLPNHNLQEVTQHLDDRVGAELDTSRVYALALL